MRTTAISYAGAYLNCRKMNVQNNPQFKGLRGQDIKQVTNESSDYIDFEIQQNYYPYRRESDSTIEAEKSKVAIQGVSPHYRTHHGSQTASYVRALNVRERLPFTEAEHKMYLNNPAELEWDKRFQIKNYSEEIRREKGIKDTAK